MAPITFAAKDAPAHHHHVHPNPKSEKPPVQRSRRMPEIIATVASLAFGNVAWSCWSSGVSTYSDSTLKSALKGLYILLAASVFLQVVSGSISVSMPRVSTCMLVQASFASTLALGGALPIVSVIGLYQEGEADSFLQLSVVSTVLAATWCNIWLAVRTCKSKDE